MNKWVLAAILLTLAVLMYVSVFSISIKTY